MKWYKMLLNPQALERLYDDVPALRGVELYSVHLKRDGPTLGLILDLPRFPDHPSARWPPESNAIQVSLSFYTIRNARMVGWSSRMLADINFDCSTNQMRVGIVGIDAELDLSFDCESFSIDRISAYINNAKH